jgi:hypothetical protein
VEFFGVFASQVSVSADGHVPDFCEPSGFSHAVAFGNVFHNGHYFFFGQSRVKEDCPAVLGKAFFAHFALEQSGGIFAVGVFDTDIFFASNAVFWAIFILTEEVFEIVHEVSPLFQVP